MGTVYKLKSDQGFTLIELVLTMIIISVLAVYAYPKFFDRSGFSEFTYQARLIASLRHMQQRAMQDTRSGFCFRIILDTDNHDFGPPDLSSVAGTCGTAVDHDNDKFNPDYLRTKKDGTSYEMAKEGVKMSARSGVTSINLIGFDGLGRPIDASNNPACPTRCEIGFIGRENTGTTPNISTNAGVCVEREGFIHACTISGI